MYTSLVILVTFRRPISPLLHIDEHHSHHPAPSEPPAAIFINELTIRSNLRSARRVGRENRKTMTTKDAAPIQLASWKCTTPNHVYYRQTPQSQQSAIDGGARQQRERDDNSHNNPTLSQTPSLEVLTLYRLHPPSVSDLTDHLAVLADQMSTNGCLYPPDEPLEQVLRQFSYETHLSWAQRELDAVNALHPVFAAYTSSHSDQAKHQLIVDWRRYVIRNQDVKQSQRATSTYAIVQGKLQGEWPIGLEVAPEAHRSAIENIEREIVQGLSASLSERPDRLQLIPDATEEFSNNLLTKALGTIAPYAKPGE